MPVTVLIHPSTPSTSLLSLTRASLGSNKACSGSAARLAVSPRVASSFVSAQSKSPCFIAPERCGARHVVIWAGAPWSLRAPGLKSGPVSRWPSFVVASVTTPGGPRSMISWPCSRYGIAPGGSGIPGGAVPPPAPPAPPGTLTMNVEPGPAP